MKKGDIIIRDVRVKTHFVIDDQYLNGYARVCGLTATGIYLCLCRHAATDQRSFPSIRTMAEKLGISTRSAMRGVEILIQWNLITKDKTRNPRTGRWWHNSYVLLDKSVWKPHKPNAQGDQVTKTTHGSPGDKNEIHQVTPGTHKDSHSIKDSHTSKPEGLQGDQWNELIDSFEELNPMYKGFYKNKTERGALEELHAQIGYEKLLNTIKALPEVTARPYAPKITKPTELRRDLGKLLTFYKQSQEKGKGIISSV